jgi:integrase
MATIKLKYVQEFVDRHGRPRWYFRRPGFPRTPLPAPPGSAAFNEAYQAALGGGTAAPGGIGPRRTLPGTVDACIVALYGSAAFRSLRPISRETYRFTLEAFRAEHGTKRIAMLERRHIEDMLAAKAGKPGAQHNLLRMLKVLLTYAVKAGLRADNPAAGLRAPKAAGDGFHTWTEDEIATFEAYYAIGTRERLAFALLLLSAQRRSDMVRMGRQHVRGDMLAVTQSKTGTSLAIPIHPSLAAIIEATPSEHLTFLVADNGRPFPTPKAFGKWFRARCDEAGLSRQCTAHGLRKAACRRLAEQGASANVIASISGHKTLREVERYTKAADQARMARAGMEMLAQAEPRTGIVKPTRKV